MLATEIFRVKLRTLQPDSITDAEKTIIIDSLRYFEDAFKSNYLKNEVLNFGNESSGFNSAYNLGLNNNEVYMKLIAAAENTGNIEHNVADLNLYIIPEPSPDGKTIGYVEDHSKIIYTYKQFITSFAIEKLSGHFAHEWTHLLGFKHPPATGMNEAYLSTTIPFAIGNLVELYVKQKQVDYNIQ